MTTHIKRFAVQQNMDGWKKDRAFRNLGAMEAALCQQYDEWQLMTHPAQIINFAVDRGIDNAMGYVRFTVVWA